MPNHIINEIIFHNVNKEKQSELLASLCNAEQKVDFEILVPIPLNVWMGSVGTRHEKAFRRTALDWSRDNWGTKWNAYSHKENKATESTLILTFETAWAPPYPWLAAVFNHFKIGFEHNWLDEGRERGIHGVFDWSKMNVFLGDPWTEIEADDELQKHLHFLHWGCESFEEEA